MFLREVSGGQISGTGTLTLGSKTLGGLNIYSDGTNAAVLVLRKDTSGGDIVYQISTLSLIFPVAPIYLGTETLYYSITGTNATAEVYEWVEAKETLYAGVPSTYK